ncbi:HD-GYP domain-containing protein [Clostridium sp. SYSU_GA19001]|uniref:HD-GYP domain-containing protein n=1 Tax=Clostridium caldaquaticum TaxID=2940653 RepID=UPI0020778300|nr:HD-GYP domain-containing protein [Clostridium caldaquaticum]MCM8709772.1 HD-GYP domain-containing protein [Clostridium caldaquaticum]
MRIVPIECVREGSYLAKTIYDNEGRVLLREGVMLSKILLRRIKLIKISSLYINDEYSDNIIEDIIKPELRQKAIKTIKDTFVSFDKYNLYSSKANSPIKEKEFIKEKQKYFQSIGDIASSIMDEILSQRNVLINVVDIKSLDNYTYQHSVNVAVLSLVLGLQLQLNKYELYSLCLGGLIHDIGKALIPKEIIQKYDKLTEKEYSIAMEHAKKGYDYLKGSPDISAPARIIALQHHERINGQGYPDGRKGNDINKLAKIVGIADVYDALTSDRPQRRALSPNEALEFIMASGGTLFDYDMVLAFSKSVVPYPEGTLVKLTNGDLAVVEENHPNFPLRPKIRIVRTADGSKKNTQVDLMSELGLVIKGVQYETPEFPR